MYTAKKKSVVMKSDVVALPFKGRYGLEKVCLNQKFLTCFVFIGYSFELKVILLPEIRFQKLTFLN